MAPRAPERAEGRAHHRIAVRRNIISRVAQPRVAAGPRDGVCDGGERGADLRRAPGAPLFIIVADGLRCGQRIHTAIRRLACALISFDERRAFNTSAEHLMNMVRLERVRIIHHQNIKHARARQPAREGQRRRDDDERRVPY